MAGLALVFVAVMFGTTLPTPLYPLYEHRLGFGEQTTTLVFATYAVGQIVAALGFGSLSDRRGRRPMLAAAIGLSSVSAVVYLLPAALGWLYLGRLLSGLSAGAVTAAASPMLVELLPARRTLATVLAATLNIGGLGLGVLASGVLAQYAPHPLRVPFAIDLVLVALAAITLITVPETVQRRHADGHRAEQNRTEQRRSGDGAWQPHAAGAFLRASLAGFAGFAVLSLFTAVAPAFMTDVLHDPNRAVTGVVACSAFAGSLLGQLISVFLAPERGLTLSCAGLILGMSLVAAALTGSSLALLLTGAIIAGGGQGVGLRAGLATVAAVAPEHRRAETTSYYFVVLYVGSALPVIGVGIASMHVSLVDSGVSFSAAIAAIAVAVVALLVRSHPQPTPARAGISVRSHP